MHCYKCFLLTDLLGLLGQLQWRPGHKLSIEENRSLLISENAQCYERPLPLMLGLKLIWLLEHRASKYHFLNPLSFHKMTIAFPMELKTMGLERSDWSDSRSVLGLKRSLGPLRYRFCLRRNFLIPLMKILIYN